MKKRNIILITAAAAAVLLIASCTSGPNPMAVAGPEKPAGFLLGLWHGFISFFAFIISLFSDRVNIYEVYNNGGWYNFGFIIGVMMFYGGGTKGSSVRRRKR